MTKLMRGQKCEIVSFVGQELGVALIVCVAHEESLPIDHEAGKTRNEGSDAEPQQSSAAQTLLDDSNGRIGM